MKISLQAEPTFEAPVPIHRPGKDPLDIKFTFKHRTTDELEEFRADAEKKKMNNVDYIMAICSGWEIEEDWNKKNLGVFFRNFHSAPAVIARVYYDELIGAKRKN